jgi:hypothetical protein
VLIELSERLPTPALIAARGPNALTGVESTHERIHEATFGDGQLCPPLLACHFFIVFRHAACRYDEETEAHKHAAEVQPVTVEKASVEDGCVIFSRIDKHLAARQIQGDEGRVVSTGPPTLRTSYDELHRAARSAQISLDPH